MNECIFNNGLPHAYFYTYFKANVHTEIVYINVYF